jgi:hypothetical protein
MYQTWIKFAISNFPLIFSFNLVRWIEVNKIPVKLRGNYLTPYSIQRGVCKVEACGAYTKLLSTFVGGVKACTPRIGGLINGGIA